MKIFVVEDDPWYRELISYHLGLNPDFEIKTFGDGKSCMYNYKIQKAHNFKNEKYKFLSRFKRKVQAI